MATKTFKEICVEYAHQLGKGLPLTPAEMCNAVIMYLNAQITEMQGITTTLQTAVSEAESSATEAINKVNDVSETVNELPKVPTPTTSDNGKVIGVQSGAYALVEQSGGEAPANMVTTDSNQSISGSKTFTGNVDVTQGRFYADSIAFLPMSGGSVSFNPPSTTQERTITLPDKNGTVALTDDIPDTTNFVTTNTEQSITATKTFNDIKVGSYELSSEGFEYSGANLVRYSASGKEIRYGLSGYNSTVIGSNVKLNFDFNTSYINCTSNNIILGNSNTAINILGTRLTYNGADILTNGSGGSNYHLHRISLYTSSTESYLREAQLIITNTSSEPFTYDTLLNYLNGTNPRMCIGYANADSFNADVKMRNFIYKNVEYNYIAFCEVKTGDEFDEIKLTELENFEKNYTTVTDIVI